MSRDLPALQVNCGITSTWSICLCLEATTGDVGGALEWYKSERGPVEIRCVLGIAKASAYHILEGAAIFGCKISPI
jgi:hypothetical protein